MIYFQNCCYHALAFLLIFTIEQLDILRIQRHRKGVLEKIEAAYDFPLKKLNVDLFFFS